MLNRHPFCGTRLAAVEPVYGTVIQLARLMLAAAGAEVHRHRRREPARHRRRGHRDQPHQLLRLHLRRACPPTSRAAAARCGSWPSKEVFDHKITGPIMRSLRHIPVDRRQRRGVLRRGLSGSSRTASWSASIPRRRSAAASRSRSSSPARPGWRSPPTCRSFRTSSGALSGSGPRATRKKMWRPKVPISVRGR